MVWKTDAVDLETLLEYVTKEMKQSVTKKHSLMINTAVFPFLDLVYIMLTWGLSFLSDMTLYFSLCYFPSAVICHCELWLHKLVFTKIHTHTHSFHSVPSWPPGSAGEATCGGRELTASDRFFRQSSGPSTADSIIQSQVPLSGSMGLGDIIVTLPSSPSVSNGGVELVKGPCE